MYSQAYNGCTYVNIYRLNSYLHNILVYIQNVPQTLRAQRGLVQGEWTMELLYSSVDTSRKKFSI